MDRKTKLFLVTFTVLVVISLVTILASPKSFSETEKLMLYNQIVAQAKIEYSAVKLRGLDTSAGPCLTNDLRSGWVLDLVHRPRQKIDDLPENQCGAYLEGRAKHFVELDLNGNLVTIK